MHGPCSEAGGSLKCPEWPNLPNVAILDTVAPVFTPERREVWRRQRGVMLDKWERCGLRFTIKEDEPEKYPALDPDTMNSAEGLAATMVPGKLRLMATPTKLGGGVGPTDHSPEAFADWRNGGGLAAFKLGPAFWQQSAWQRAYLLTHETGHALGLNHRPQYDDNKSVMNGDARVSIYPDSHDLQSLRGYYSL
jgi:hypothetical protein